jgi:succinyl-diaminopimelate desuccinylase
LQQRVHAILDKHGLDYQLDWSVSGHPFLTPRGELSNALCAAIKTETGIDTELSTSGGTSDGRFIARLCPQVIEFGPSNATIHKVNENIPVAEVEPLKNIYRRLLENLLR